MEYSGAFPPSPQLDHAGHILWDPDNDGNGDESRLPPPDHFPVPPRKMWLRPSLGFKPPPGVFSTDQNFLRFEAEPPCSFSNIQKELMHFDHTISLKRLRAQERAAEQRALPNSCSPLQLQLDSSGWTILAKARLQSFKFCLPELIKNNNHRQKTVLA